MPYVGVLVYVTDVHNTLNVTEDIVSSQRRRHCRCRFRSRRVLIVVFLLSHVILFLVRLPSCFSYFWKFCVLVPNSSFHFSIISCASECGGLCVFTRHWLLLLPPYCNSYKQAYENFWLVIDFLSFRQFNVCECAYTQYFCELVGPYNRFCDQEPLIKDKISIS